MNAFTETATEFWRAIVSAITSPGLDVQIVRTSVATLAALLARFLIRRRVWVLTTRANCTSAAVMVAVALTSGCATTSNEQGAPPPNTALDDQPPRMVNAFFGLDDALPMRAAGICLEAPGADGMPVTFSRGVGTLIISRDATLTIGNSC